MSLCCCSILGVCALYRRVPRFCTRAKGCTIMVHLLLRLRELSNFCYSTYLKLKLLGTTNMLE
jgi:hypothetical protein